MVKGPGYHLYTSNNPSLILDHPLMLSTGEGETVLSVCAYYCWLDLIKQFVDTEGHNPISEWCIYLNYYQCLTIVN